MAESILRSVNTHFWDDPYVADHLDPSEKLLFLYFLTNPLTNLLGIYEISLKRISVDTGFDRDMVLKIIRRFSEDGKIYYYENYIILPNRFKHQNLNSNMEKNVKKLFINLPDKIKEFIIDRDLKAFERLLKPSKFQFQFGAIKRCRREIFKRPHADFNSNLVRLKGIISR